MCVCVCNDGVLSTLCVLGLKTATQGLQVEKEVCTNALLTHTYTQNTITYLYLHVTHTLTNTQDLELKLVDLNHAVNEAKSKVFTIAIHPVVQVI